MADDRMESFDESWNVLYLDSKRMPGIARVEADAPTGLDKQKSRGKKKARVVDRGRESAVLSIELEIEPSEMPLLKVAMNTLRPRGKTAPQKELTIGHPMAAFYDIALVKIGKIGSPRIGPGGNFFLNFEAIEHVPQPAKVKKPKASTGDEGDWDVQKRIDALKRPSQAVEQNFTAPEDITNFSAQSGDNIFIPEPTYSPAP